uniref:ATP-dependent RNA helicase n=1 Tax=Biomphalaria glabrata TaxID=6526 RepID=A0A2C9JSW7_BIOGL
MKAKMQKFSFEKKKTKTSLTKRSKDFKKIQEKRKKKKKNHDDEEIEALNLQLWPPLGQPKDNTPPKEIKLFSDLPISKKTLEGLKTHNFITPTDIQRESLLYGLKGHDILGAAKTGSGKTLAFLIPILETLFKQRYTPSFGMAALIISPTRELAYQSFDVLKKIGKFHDLSFGLVTGGMLLKEEAKRMNSTNIVICTPGRLLQHFEQTPNFTADDLKILVLDEADKILHLGFADTMNAIIEALPKQRQTILFSATQTRSVKDLARLSLKKPIYVSVHEKAKETTPTSLEQRYIVCKMQDKVNTLWSFIKSHKHKKILVFLSCCKQTRYLYQVFKKMHPGLTILCMHGHMKQHQRMEVYDSFSRKQHAVLLATDVAARGLDFPAVNWVVQVDKPENVETYIHRVGRTARYEKSGEALLLLLPAEEKKMVEDLIKRKIPIVKLKVNRKQLFDVTKKLESLCASNKDLKDNAQRAFISSMKTLYVLDKPCFHSVDLDAYAVSLGLVQAPTLPFIGKLKSKVKGQGEKERNVTDGSQNSEFEKSENIERTIALDFGMNEDDDNDNIYNIVKDVQEDEFSSEKMEQGLVPDEPKKKKSSAKSKLKLLKYTTRITFDEDGNPEGEDKDEDVGGLNIDEAKERMKQQDKLDKELHRQNVKEKHREKRLKLKEKRRLLEMEKRGQSVTENDETHDTYEETYASTDSNSESSDDEPKPKKVRLEDKEDTLQEMTSEESDDSENTTDNDDEGEDIGDDGEDITKIDEPDDDIHKTEAAVLALLGTNP